MEAVVSLPLLSNQIHRVKIVEEISGSVLNDTELDSNLGIEIMEIRNSPWPVIMMRVWSGRYHFAVNHMMI